MAQIGSWPCRSPVPDRPPGACHTRMSLADALRSLPLSSCKRPAGLSPTTLASVRCTTTPSRSPPYPVQEAAWRVPSCPTWFTLDFRNVSQAKTGTTGNIQIHEFRPAGQQAKHFSNSMSFPIALGCCRAHLTSKGEADAAECTDSLPCSFAASDSGRVRSSTKRSPIFSAAPPAFRHVHTFALTCQQHRGHSPLKA